MGTWCGQMGAGDWIGMIVLWGVVIATGVWAVGRLFPTTSPTPREVLDARLAAGDLTALDYRRLREELDGVDPVRMENVS